jgi:hypothetical protein
MECVISVNEEPEVARLLMNASIRRLQYRAELGEAEWQALLPDHDVFLCKWQGTPVAVHVLLRDPPGRARLLLSGSADRGDKQLRGVVGPANRLLHWHELLHYKTQGYRFYDFGGCDLDPASETYPVTQFKLSFGGEVAEEPMLYLSGNPLLRFGLRGFGAAQRLLRRVPWPEAWRKAFRSRPRSGASSSSDRTG